LNNQYLKEKTEKKPFFLYRSLRITAQKTLRAHNPLTSCAPRQTLANFSFFSLSHALHRARQTTTRARFPAVGEQALVTATSRRRKHRCEPHRGHACPLVGGRAAVERFHGGANWRAHTLELMRCDSASSIVEGPSPSSCMAQLRPTVFIFYPRVWTDPWPAMVHFLPVWRFGPHWPQGSLRRWAPESSGKQQLLRRFISWVPTISDPSDQG
jgi:hypothetical protein